MQIPDELNIDPLVADAARACAEVRGHAIDLHKTEEQKLRAVREAGRLLALVDRSVGGRRPKNWSSGLTSYQQALKAGHVSRQTASQWRRVSEVSDETFEAFIASAPAMKIDLTIEALLRSCDPRTPETRRTRIVTFVLSQTDYDIFQKHLAALRAAHCAASPADTLMTVFEDAYEDWHSSHASAPPID